MKQTTVCKSQILSSYEVACIINKMLFFLVSSKFCLSFKSYTGDGVFKV